MVETASTMLPLGTKAPSFTLLDVVSNKELSLQDIKSEQGTVIMFICNHCPYVIHIQSKLFEIAKHYQAQGIQFAAINANDVENYPEDSPEKMKKLAQEYNISFPYLFDETQAVAKAYNAVCTPDFFLFDKDLRCVYRGQFDSARPGNNKPVTGESLTQAMDALLNNEVIDSEQIPSVGCNIKWK
jgi:peroxiredoxin